MKIDFTKNKKKLITLIIALLVLITSVTYAFFVSSIGEDADTSFDVGSEVSESMKFELGNPITIFANLDNFSSTDGSLIGETTGSVILRSSSSIGSATKNYYVYFNIHNNSFLYTTDDNKPELILTVTDPEGNNVTSITGLEYKSVVDAKTGETISGFDVTTQTGLITISDNYEITTTSTRTHEWKVKLTFVNLDTLQRPNEGKKFESDLVLSSEEFQISDACKSEEFGSCIAYNYEISPGLIKHDATAINGADDNNFRYSGSNDVVTNNYLCFGSSEAVCPEENIYRIVGIYNNNLKIVKNEVINDIAYHSSAIDDFSSTDVYNYLNTTYYENFDTIYKNMIADYVWYTAGNNTAIENANEFYNSEVVNLEFDKAILAKVGLISAYDYGYSTTNNNWTSDLSNYSAAVIAENNWLYQGYNTWTISPDTSNLNNAFIIGDAGTIMSTSASEIASIRPAFYLATSVKLLSGTGTINNPFILSM